MPITIDQLQIDSFRNSREHGFWADCPDPDDPAYRSYIGNKLMLIVGEVSEAHEELRKREPDHTYHRDDGKPEGVIFELVDVLIRVADLAEHLGFDLTEAIREKHAYNVGREHLHGKKF